VEVMGWSNLTIPKKIRDTGSRAPTGLLLEGPQGTRQDHGASNRRDRGYCPLLYCSGLAVIFVEMFWIGRAPHELAQTERADKLSPCIIFIDELDALGRLKARDSGLGDGAFSW
jgi:cell division protease FtsH